MKREGPTNIELPHPQTGEPRAGRSYLVQRLLSGGFWAIAVRVVGGFAAAGLAMVVTRLLSPRDAGSYFLAVSVVTIASALITVGLPQAAVRLIGEAIGVRSFGRAKQTAFLVLAFGGLSAVAGGGLTAWILSRLDSFFGSAALQTLQTHLSLLAIWVATSAILVLFAGIFQAFSDIRLSTFFSGPATTVIVLITLAPILYWQRHATYAEVLAVSAVATIASMLLALVLARQLWNSLAADRSRASMRRLFATALPLVVVSATMQFAIQADVWIIGARRSAQEVALYAAARQLLGPIGMPISIVNVVAAPLIAELYAQKRTKELQAGLRGFTGLAAVPMLVPLVVFLGWGGEIMGWFFGGFYAQGAIVLKLFSVAKCADLLTGSCGLALVMTGNQNFVMLITGFYAALSIVGALLLVGRFGIDGVAFAVATSWILQTCSFLFVARAKTGIWTHAGLRPLFEMLRNWKLGVSAPARSSLS